MGTGGIAVIIADKLISVIEVRFEREECCAGDVKGGFEAGEKDGMVDERLVEVE